MARLAARAASWSRDRRARPDLVLPPGSRPVRRVRNEHARKRGLPGPYIAGGDDPEIEKTLRYERRYVRLLIAMVVAIVALGFLLGIVEVMLNIRRRDRRPSERDRRSVARPAVGERSARRPGPTAHERLVGFLRDLIRIPSINPPDPPGPELDAANRDRGRAPGGRPRARGRRAGPRAGAASWRGCAATARAATRCCCSRTSTSSRPWRRAGRIEPFAADIVDGYVWGRGAVDMKAMVALEVGVLRLLARRAVDAGLDPATRPDPGPPARRPVRVHRRRGGRRLDGAGWLVDHRPETIRAAGALNEAGGMPFEVGGPPLLRDHGRGEGLRDVPRSACTADGVTARCRATTTRSSARPTS